VTTPCNIITPNELSTIVAHNTPLLVARQYLLATSFSKFYKAVLEVIEPNLTAFYFIDLGDVVTLVGAKVYAANSQAIVNRISSLFRLNDQIKPTLYVPGQLAKYEKAVVDICCVPMGDKFAAEMMIEVKKDKATNVATMLSPIFITEKQVQVYVNTILSFVGLPNHDFLLHKLTAEKNFQATFKYGKNLNYVNELAASVTPALRPLRKSFALRSTKKNL